MAFAFERDDTSIEHGLRRIVIEQIDKALLEASAPQAGFDATVHWLRRRCKNLRGLLRLVRPVFAAFKREDRAVQAVASRLSQARDAAVMLQTFDALIDDVDEPPLDPRDARQLRSMLTERSRGLILHIDEPALLREFCQAMVAMRERAAKWRLTQKRFGAIAGGLENSYRQLRARMRTAAVDGSPGNLHAWRKQAKYHRHHMTLLRQHAPDVLDSRGKLLAELGDVLGQHHDLAVLAEMLNGRVTAASAALTTIVERAGKRQQALADRAFALGGQIAAEKPAALTARLRRYWTLEAA